MSIPKELKQKIEDLDCLVNPDPEEQRTVINQLLKLFESEQQTTETKQVPPKENTPKEDTPKEDTPKEDTPKEDTPKEDTKESLAAKLQTLLSDPRKYEKERIKVLTDMLSKFPKYEGTIRYNELTIFNSKDAKYYLLFEVPNNEKDNHHLYSSRLLIEIKEETFNYFKNSELEADKDIEMGRNRAVPHMHAEICQGTNKNGFGWGIMIVSDYDPNIKYGEHGYYNKLGTFPFPLDFAPGTRL